MDQFVYAPGTGAREAWIMMLTLLLDRILSADHHTQPVLLCTAVEHTVYPCVRHCEPANRSACVNFSKHNEGAFATGAFKNTQTSTNMEPTFSTWFRARRTSCAFCECSLFAGAEACPRVALSTEITVPSERRLHFQQNFFSSFRCRFHCFPVFSISLEWIKLSRYLSFTNVAANWTELFALVVRLSCNLKAFHSFCEAKWKIIMLNVFFARLTDEWRGWLWTPTYLYFELGHTKTT